MQNWIPLRSHNEFSYLRERFLAIFQNNTNNWEIEAFFNEVKTQYQDPTRHHHNLNHILEIIRYIDERKDSINNWEAVQLAIWLHDIIYDVRNIEPWKNERDSIDFSRHKLSLIWVKDETIHRVSLHIWDTIKHIPTQELWADGEYFLDGDLSVLWGSPERYREYKDAIRKEYWWVPQDIYNTERVKIMWGFLQREKVFFRNQALEITARKNISSEISELS